MRRLLCVLLLLSFVTSAFGLQRDVAAQKVVLYAYDKTSGIAAVEDPTTWTIMVSLDGAAANAATNTATAAAVTNQSGMHILTLDQTETDAALVSITATTATANILIEPLVLFTFAETPSVLLANGAHGGAAASIALADYSSFKATGFSTHDPAAVKTAMEADGSKLDTLYDDWLNNGRLDAILDTIAVDVAGLDGAAMRGTNDANTTVPDAAGTAAALHAVTDALINGLVVPDVAGTAAALHAVTDALINGLTVPDPAGTAAGLHATTDAAIAAANTQATAAARKLLLDTTIAGVTSQTVIALTAGADFNSAYKNMIVVLYDVSNNNYPSIRTANAYVGATKALTLDAAPDFTVAPGDTVRVFVSGAVIYVGD